MAIVDPEHFLRFKGIKKYKIVRSSQVAIFFAEWHSDLTLRLVEDCVTTLMNLGVRKKYIHKYAVPGSLELPIGVQFLLESSKTIAYEVIICIGCVIKGDTPHFDYVCQGVNNGIMQVSLKYNIPIVSGILTTLNKKQAEDRVDGTLTNKGVEAALTAVAMISLKKNIEKQHQVDEEKAT